MPDASTEVTWDDFLRVDLRVGTVTAVEEFPEARRPAYKLWIDFGPELGVRKSSAQLTRLYTVTELVGRQVVAVVNFPRKQVGPFMSEVLVTGFADAAGAIVLAQPERPVPNGARLV
ncbi:MAG: tRNA-binding protein [Gemmataceae bacterium]